MRSADDDQPVSTLRGAGVTVDSRRVGRALAVGGLAALAVVVVSLFLGGIHRNQRISEVRQHGVVVSVTVSGCQGLLGGSGSNGAGYACTGTFTVDGHRHREGLPGNTRLDPGTHLQAVVVPSDPKVLFTLRGAATARTSETVFILPAVLLVVLVAGTALFVRRLRRTKA